MRGRGEQDEPVGTGGQALRELVALADAAGTLPLGDVVGLVDDDEIPPRRLKSRPVLPVVLEGVDGDDGLVELIEGVVVQRDAGPDLPDPRTVDPDERDREAGPEFLLELGEHRLGGDDENALGPAPEDELGGEQACLKRLPEADVIAHEDASAGRSQGEADWVELEVEVVDGRLARDLDGVAGRRRLTKRGLDVEQCI